MLKYPASLPVAQKADRAYQMVDPLVSTPFDNGQTRWDRQFSDVPYSTPVSWIFTDAELALFRTWYTNILNWGVEWFEMPLAAEDGREVRECHFVQGYSGPQRLTFDRWKVTANLVLRRLPTIDPDWLELPEFWLPPGRSIFDNAINNLWPDNKYQTYIVTFDRTVNEEWPA